MRILQLINLIESTAVNAVRYDWSLLTSIYELLLVIQVLKTPSPITLTQLGPACKAGESATKECNIIN